MRATYILPIKTTDASQASMLADYIRNLQDLEVIVVDGSSPEIFALHRKLLHGSALHIPPDNDIAVLNGKARGVLTGLRHASTEKIIVADDDVRHDSKSIQFLLSRLESYDAVLPQNYFAPAPWHAIIDTARSLLNRVTGGDWPGTIGFRKSRLPFGYDGDVLFENYEMVRTIRCNGGSVLRADACYVRRVPPTLTHYLRQRVRQAYDEFARPRRLAAQLAIVPLCSALIAMRSTKALLLAAALTVGAAECGRRAAGGRRYFSPLASLAAPLWVFERGVCSWLALYSKLRYGGIRYGDTFLENAATSGRIARGAA